jgi:choline dehydrogenase-like flavoprotein
MSSTHQFDAIVVGSGVTGGFAAKELTEKGLRVLMVERGRMIEHQADYKTEMLPPWELPFRGYGDPQIWAQDYAVQSKGRYFDEWTQAHFVNDREHPYQTTGPDPFQWRRSYQLGGRSLVWGRQCFRWSEHDFEANARDGYGVDWPIRYADLAPWYDHVEDFIGVQGAAENNAALPDGRFQPPFQLNVVEKVFRDKLSRAYPDRCFTIARSAHLTEGKDARAPCQYRNLCARGCSYGAYFSTQSSTLPAARATGRLTLLTDALVQILEHDPKTARITGVRVLNTKTRERTIYRARVVFLCASTFNSIAILLRSAHDGAPNGLANSSGVLGQYIMEHVGGGPGAAALVPGFGDKTTFGNRPTGTIVPRFQNLGDSTAEFLRGYCLFGASVQLSWRLGEVLPGIGETMKQHLRRPGPWLLGLSAHGEMLPRKENQITLDPKRLDPEGSPQIRIAFSHGDNERKMMADAEKEAKAMLSVMGGLIVSSSKQPGPPGTTVHEMGGARMGNDPNTSVLNGHNQAHDIANLFVTDGACMSSTASVNPSLTYMALTARACDTAVSMLKNNLI